MTKPQVEEARVMKQNPIEDTSDIMATITGGVGLGQIEEIKEIEIRKTPFLAYLEEKGRVRDVKSAVVTFRYLDYSASDAASVLAEGGTSSSIVEPTAGTNQVRMSIFGTAVRVSHLAQYGFAPEMDLVKSTVEDGIKQVLTLKEKAILKSTGITGEANLTFDGLYEQISADASRVFEADLTGNTPDVLMDKIDDAIIDLEEKDSTQATVLVARANVMKQIGKEVKEDEAYQFMISDLDNVLPGVAVTGIRTATGVKVPIIETPNAPNDVVYVLDEESLHFDVLMRETFFEVPQADLSFYGPILSYAALALEFPSRNRIVEITWPTP